MQEAGPWEDGHATDSRGQSLAPICGSPLLVRTRSLYAFSVLLPQVHTDPSCAKLAPLSRNSTEFLRLSHGTAGLVAEVNYPPLTQYQGACSSGLSSGLTLEPALNEQNRFCGYSLDEEQGASRDRKSAHTCCYMESSHSGVSGVTSMVS